MEYKLRPASEVDREFPYSLHCQTMRATIETTWGWDEAWQREDFKQRFHQCDVSIIERAKQLHERLGVEVAGFEAPFFRMRYNIVSSRSSRLRG